MKPRCALRAIRFERGGWWFFDQERDLAIRVCGLLETVGWRVSGLCCKLGISRRTFERMANVSLGIPSKLWIRQLRALRAMHRLRESSPIKVISAELGFR